MTMTRRALLKAGVMAAPVWLGACSAHRHRGCGTGATEVQSRIVYERTSSGFEVYVAGPASGRSVLVLHELPGLTPDDVAFVERLAARGFRVHVPLLFGGLRQDNFLRGYWQACIHGEFECGDRSTRSPILDRLDRVVDEMTPRGTIGIVGMCLTGVLPLALLRPGVAAAVLCQPTLPFNFFAGRPTGAQKPDLGLGAADVEHARASPVSVLAVRYAADRLCPVERFAALAGLLPQRVAVAELDGDGHSSMAGDCHADAFEDVVAYLSVALGRVTSAQRMRTAVIPTVPIAAGVTGPKLAGVPCEFTADRRWRAVA